VHTYPPIPEFTTAVCVMWLLLGTWQSVIQSIYSTLLPVGLNGHNYQSEIYLSPGDKGFILNACALNKHPLSLYSRCANTRGFIFTERLVLAISAEFGGVRVDVFQSL
jgi:hypothetical protein